MQQNRGHARALSSWSWQAKSIIRKNLLFLFRDKKKLLKLDILPLLFIFLIYTVSKSAQDDYENYPDPSKTPERKSGNLTAREKKRLS